jgi:hypothetical protein
MSIDVSPFRPAGTRVIKMFRLQGEDDFGRAPVEFTENDLQTLEITRVSDGRLSDGIVMALLTALMMKSDKSTSRIFLIDALYFEKLFGTKNGSFSADFDTEKVKVPNLSSYDAILWPIVTQNHWYYPHIIQSMDDVT